MQHTEHTKSQAKVAALPLKRYLLWFGVIVTVILLAVLTSHAAGRSSARSVGMGGAYIGLAKGVDAARYNPANLGLSGYRDTRLEIVGVGARLTNNSFTLNDYNTYTGAFLTADDKDYILNQIPDEGLKLDADIEAGAVSFSSGQFAFAVTGVGAADVNLSKDLFELALNGNTFADTIDVTGSYSDGISFVTAGLSYGTPIYSKGTRQLAVGVTAKYIKGLFTEEVVELEGLAATLITGWEGDGRMIARSAEGGSGFAVDLGASLRLNDSYTVGASLMNAVGSISWNDNPKEYGYLFNFDTMTVDNSGDDYVVSEDYETEIDAFSTRLPRVLTVGLAKTRGSLVWALDWRQGLESKPGVSTKPRIMAGVEWSPIGILPLRLGYGLGGDENAAFSFGSGLHFAMVELDFAVVTGSSLSGYSSKGANLALSLGINL
jgi:hypothetical protein